MMRKLAPVLFTICMIASIESPASTLPDTSFRFKNEDQVKLVRIDDSNYQKLTLGPNSKLLSSVTIRLMIADQIEATENLQTGDYDLMVNKVPVAVNHGEYTKYYSDGTVEIKGFYKYGTKTGHWEHYDILGKLIKEEDYPDVERPVLVE